MRRQHDAAIVCITRKDRALSRSPGRRDSAENKDTHIHRVLLHNIVRGHEEDTSLLTGQALRPVSEATRAVKMMEKLITESKSGPKLYG